MVEQRTASVVPSKNDDDLDIDDDDGDDEDYDTFRKEQFRKLNLSRFNRI